MCELEGGAGGPWYERERERLVARRNEMEREGLVARGNERERGLGRGRAGGPRK